MKFTRTTFELENGQFVTITEDALDSNLKHYDLGVETCGECRGTTDDPYNYAIDGLESFLLALHTNNVLTLENAEQVRQALIEATESIANNT